MELIVYFLFTSSRILVMILGGMGAILSLSLLLYPNMVYRLGRSFNRRFDLDRQFSRLEKEIPTDPLIFRRNILSGTAFVAASVFFLFFLFVQLDGIAPFRSPILTHPSAPLLEVLWHAVLLLGKIAGISGLLIGALLLAAPRKLQRIETRMSSWVNTQATVDRLNRFHYGLDSMFYRRPVLFGLMGFTASLVLLASAISF